jgi:hypothetical protein
MGSTRSIVVAQDDSLPLTQTYTTYHELTFSYPEDWYVGTDESANIWLYNRKIPDQEIKIAIAYPPAGGYFYPAGADLGPDATPRDQLEAAVANATREFVCLGAVSDLMIGTQPTARVDGAFEEDTFVWFVTQLEDGKMLGMFVYGEEDTLHRMEPTVLGIIASAFPPGGEPTTLPTLPPVTISPDDTIEALPLAETFTMRDDVLFDYPEGWSVEVNEIGLVVLHSSEQADAGMYIAVSYVRPGEWFSALGRELDADVPPRVLVDAMIIHASESHMLVDLSATDDITIEDTAAARVTGIYSDEAPLAFIWMIARLEDGAVMGLFAYSPAEMLPHIEPTMQAIIASTVYPTTLRRGPGR